MKLHLGFCKVSVTVSKVPAYQLSSPTRTVACNQRHHKPMCQQSPAAAQACTHARAGGDNDTMI